MKVLFVTSAFPADSADPRGIFVLQLARALITSGIDVHVLSPGHPWAANTGSVANVPVTRAPYWRKRGQALAVGLGGIVPNIRRRPWLAVQVPPLVAAMTRSVRKLATDFDVVHAHWVYPSGLACVLNRRQFDAPLVVTAHGGDLNLAERSRVLRQLSRYVIRRVDACIGVGPALVDAFVKLGASEDNAHFIPPATPCLVLQREMVAQARRNG